MTSYCILWETPDGVILGSDTGTLISAPPEEAASLEAYSSEQVRRVPVASGIGLVKMVEPEREIAIDGRWVRFPLPPYDHIYHVRAGYDSLQCIWFIGPDARRVDNKTNEYFIQGRTD